MAVNKVIFDNEVLIDLSGDSVTKASLAKGYTAHDCHGDVIEGILEEGTAVDQTGSGKYIWQKNNEKIDWLETRKTEGTAKPSGFEATVYRSFSITEDGFYSLSSGYGLDEFNLPSGSENGKTKKILYKPYGYQQKYQIWTLSNEKGNSGKKGDTILGYISSESDDTYPNAGAQDNIYYTKIFDPEVNVTSYSMLEGTVACGEKGKTFGNIKKVAAQTIVPGTEDKKISSGVYLSGTQTIKGDVNLTAGNIAEGVEIFGVTGTLKTAYDYSGKTILVAGDSIMAGWGWEEGKGVTEPLKERYPNATWTNIAESGANMAVTSNSEHTPIVTQIKSYTGAADAIVFDGGVNDVNSNIPIGSISAGYDASYDTSTFYGAMESSLQYIMDRYPLAVKLYVIPHSFSKDNSYVNTIYAKAIEICDKWNMPYVDMRKYAQIAMTLANKAKYTYNPNTGEGDGVHPVEAWYRTFYCPIIDQQLQMLGIAYTNASEVPDVVAVTGVKLDKNTLTLSVGESEQLTATVLPSNATNQSVTWSVSNSNVSVSNGKVTANTAGMSVITVTTVDGGYTSQCSVTINAGTATEHTELKSITLDGSCYFNTEIYPDQNTNTEAEYYIKSGSTYIAGARDDNYKYGYTCTDNIYVVRGTVSSAAKSAAFWEDTWTIKQNGMSTAVNSTTLGMDATEDFTLTSPFYLGNMSKNGNTAGAGLIGKVYYAKIFAGTELVADMIPVKKSDGTLCLYDKTRKKYIYNSGSGNVTQ